MEMNQKYWVFLLGVGAGGFLVMLVAVNLFPTFSVFALVAYLFGMVILSGQIFRCPYCDHPVRLRMFGIFPRLPGKHCENCGKGFDLR